MTPDNISRFPHSGQRRRSATSEHCGLSDAEIAQRTRKFLADWDIGLAAAKRAVEEETAEIIAATRRARIARIASTCREDETHQMEKIT